MTMKAENNVLGRGLTLLALYNIVQCRVLLHKLVHVNYSSNVFLFLVLSIATRFSFQSNGLRSREPILFSF